MKRLLIALVLVSACASAPPKQIAAQSLQVSETALAAAQDIERSICFVNPDTERGNHCTNPAAAAVQLTDAVHIKFAQGFSKAFAVQITAALEVQTWKPGQAPPTNFTTYSTAAQDVLGLAQALTASNLKVSDLLAKAQAAVQAAKQIAQSMGVQ